MNKILLTILIIGFALTSFAEVKPLKILHLAGGCCHDYKTQQKLIKDGLESRLNCKVDAFVEGTNKKHKHSVFTKENWSKGYDAVVFNICFGGVIDDKFIESIVDETVKDGKGALFIHCSLHSFREAKSGTTKWRAFMGLSSKNHGKKSPILVENLKPKHPIMKGFPQMWKTPNGELYNIFAQGDDVEILGKGHYPNEENKSNSCIWTNKYQESKIFGMSLGHHNETVAAKEYQDILSRGLLWTLGKLTDEGKAAEGFGK